MHHRQCSAEYVPFDAPDLESQNAFLTILDSIVLINQQDHFGPTAQPYIRSNAALFLFLFGQRKEFLGLYNYQYLDFHDVWVGYTY